MAQRKKAHSTTVLGGLVFASLAVGASACGDDGASSGSGGSTSASGGSVQVQISGEEFATEGFRFPTGSEVTIADGWQIEFDHVLVAVDEVWLSDAPDTAPGDASQTGSVVARARGPWVVDLAKPGSVPGAGGEGTAIPLVAIDAQTENGGAPFEADQRYAFSFSLAAPTSDATRVNFEGDAAAESALEAMIAGGYTVMYVGRATFRGDASCTTSDASYDFASIPTEVPFEFGFATPTKYLNCQNEENQGDPFPDEEFQRGVAIKANAPSTAQITMHLEHPFYSDVEHEPVLYFDPFAAQLAGAADGTLLTMSALEGVDPTALTDAGGASLPWRRCDGGELGPGAQRSYEAGSIPIGPGQDPTQGFRDMVDFVRYVQSAQGHLNGGEGLCFIDRQYDSPR
jgi:hypothetical protein